MPSDRQLGHSQPRHFRSSLPGIAIWLVLIPAKRKNAAPKPCLLPYRFESSAVVERRSPEFMPPCGCERETQLARARRSWTATTAALPEPAGKR